MLRRKSIFDIFDRMPEERILKLTDFFSDDILVNKPDESKIKEIVGHDYNGYDIKSIIITFRILFKSKLEQKEILNFMDRSILKPEKKEILKKIIKKIHDKTNSNNNLCTKGENLFLKSTNTLLKNRNINKDRMVFNNFVKEHIDDPNFKDKYIAIVNGKFEDVGDERIPLIKKIYAKFGKVDMYVGKVTNKKRIVMIDTLRSIGPLDHNTEDNPSSLIVDARVWNDRAGFCDVKAKIDTGADQTVIPENIPDLLDLNYTGDVPISGVNGEGEYETYGAYIEIKGIKFDFFEVVAIPRIEGDVLLGRDLINLWKLEIDGKNKRFTIKPWSTNPADAS